MTQPEIDAHGQDEAVMTEERSLTFESTKRNSDSAFCEDF